MSIENSWAQWPAPVSLAMAESIKYEDRGPHQPEQKARL
jgi:hypothetical protein